MLYCLNHPMAATSTVCANCTRPFCDSCLVEFLGQRLCGPCRDLRLAETQGTAGAAVGAPLAGTGTVDLGGWLRDGWQIVQGDLGIFILAGFVGMLISMFSCNICYGPIFCGYFMMAFRKMTYGHVQFDNLFDGFRRFLPAFLVVLTIGFIQFAIAFPLGLAMGALGETQSNSTTLVMIQLATQGLSYLISGTIMGLTLFVLPHVAARNAQVGEAFGASWSVVQRNPMMFVLTGIVFMFLQMLGVCFLCLGVPFIAAAQAKAYADHFGIAGWDAV